MDNSNEKFLVAVASSDGITVDTHFGHAEKFMILEVNANDGTYNEIEERSVENFCGSDSCGNKHENAIEALSDVNYVLCARIGPHAIQALAKKGIRAYDIVLQIDEAIKKITFFHKKVKV